MTPRQKIELRRSEVRTRLGEIATLEGDALTDEVREERDGLMVELRDSEPQLQAAITAESETVAERAAEFADADARHAIETPEEREFRALQDGAELREYAAALASGRELEGRAAELNAAIFERSNGGAAEIRTSLLAEGDGGVLVPWSALAGRAAPEIARNGSSATAMRAASEDRADAASALPATGVQVGERDFVGRVFAGGAFDFLGGMTATVAVGEASYFVLTAGATPESKAAGAVKDAEAATLTGIVMEPHRLSAAYTMRIEDLARSMRYESGLRQDLAGAAREAVDNIVLNGQADGPDGLLDVLAAPADPDAVPTRSRAVQIAAEGVDGRYARNLREVRTLIGDESYRVLASLFTDDGDSSAADYLMMNSGGLAASALLPDPDAGTKIQHGVLARAGVMGNMVAAFWDMAAMTIVRDEYTRANRGEIRLQLNMLWDFRVLRAAGFKFIKYKTAA